MSKKTLVLVQSMQEQIARIEREKAALAAALAELRAKGSALPDGWVAVPVEPTVQMIAAFQKRMSREFGMRTTAGYHARVYRAMLSARPNPNPEDRNDDHE